MLARAAAAAVLVVMTAGGCSWDEHVCGGGEYPVKPVDGGIGAQCVKDGKAPPEGFEAYPKGKVPEVIGDQWNIYWSQKQIEVTKAVEQMKALTTLRSVDEPRGWNRVNIGEIGSIAAPESWTVENYGDSIRLDDGTATVEVTLEENGEATIYDRAKAIRKEGTETTDPIFDVDVPAQWPGGTEARYVRTNRDRGDGFVSSEALLVVAKDGSLVVVRGSVSDMDEDIYNTVPGKILRTLLLGGS